MGCRDLRACLPATSADKEYMWVHRPARPFLCSEERVSSPQAPACKCQWTSQDTGGKGIRPEHELRSNPTGLNYHHHRHRQIHQEHRNSHLSKAQSLPFPRDASVSRKHRTISDSPCESWLVCGFSTDEAQTVGQR